jgi:hypothetical protein
VSSPGGQGDDDVLVDEAKLNDAAASRFKSQGAIAARCPFYDGSEQALGQPASPQKTAV